MRGRRCVAPAAAPAERARAWIGALGGAANLLAVDACTTRLRLKVADQAAVDEPGLRQLGARGMVRPAPQALQVVIGTVADQLAGEIRAALHSAPPGGAAVAHADAPAPTVPAAAAPAAVGETPPWNARAAALLSALGGPGQRAHGGSGRESPAGERGRGRARGSARRSGNSACAAWRSRLPAACI